MGLILVLKLSVEKQCVESRIRVILVEGVMIKAYRILGYLVCLIFTIFMKSGYCEVKYDIIYEKNLISNWVCDRL